MLLVCLGWLCLEREVKEHGNDDHSEPCVELVRGCATGGCDDDVSEPPKVNPHRLCALRGLPVVIPVPDEDEELIPASMPEPVGSREPPVWSRTRAGAARAGRGSGTRGFMFLWEIRNIKSMWPGAINPTFPLARCACRAEE